MADTISNKPWDGSPARWDDAGAYCDACLVNENSGPRSGWTKSACHLPVKEPSGDYNRTALGSAAAALTGARGGGVKLPAAVKKAAAKKLVAIYARFQLPVPDSLKNMAH